MKLKNEEKIKIIKLSNEGYSIKDLCEMYNVSKTTIATIRSLYKIHKYDFLSKNKKK